MVDDIRVLVMGAHPDDPDIRAGGTAALFCKMGHTVKLVSLTNGDAGHQNASGAILARRRRNEAGASGAVIGAEYITLDNHDGELEVTLVNRKEVIRIIRSFQPRIVITHRPNDYHPDHRYTSQLVQDAMYMVTVPNICPDVPHLMYNPVLMYMADNFTKPFPFSPTVAINIDSVQDTKLKMMHQHTSQFYEWLPYNYGYLDIVPPADDEAGRIAMLDEKWSHRWNADRYRDLLIQEYGEQLGQTIKYAEAFEWGEHGAAYDPALFPFFPKKD